jgi:hypothetical protein
MIGEGFTTAVLSLGALHISIYIYLHTSHWTTVGSVVLRLLTFRENPIVLFGRRGGSKWCSMALGGAALRTGARTFVFRRLIVWRAGGVWAAREQDSKVRQMCWELMNV